MSELAAIKKAQEEMMNGWTTLTEDLNALKALPKNEEEKRKADPLYKERQEKIDKMIDTNEDNIQKLHDLLEEVSKLKASEGYSDEAKAQKEIQLKADFNMFIRKEQSEMKGEAYNAHLTEYYSKAGNIAGNDADGGFFVRPEHAASIVERVFESSPLRGLASAITLGTGEYVVPVDFTEVETRRRAETEAVARTKGPQFNEVRIEAHEIYAFPLVSRKLLDDSIIDFETYISNQVTKKFSRDEAFDFIKGDGVKRAKGILDYPDYTAPEVDEFGKIEQIPTETVDKIDLLSSIDLVDSVLDEFQGNASLLMRRQTRSQYRRLLDLDGRPLWEPSLQRGIPSTWFSYPIFTATHMDPVVAGGGASGNLVVAFGDFRQGYQIVDRLGLRIIRDEITIPGFVQWHMWRRVGGGVVDFQAIKLLRLKSA